MAHAAPYKPSPLSYGSPRTSPFRRPESPVSPFRRPESPSPSSPTSTIRATTPTPLGSPTKTLQTPFTSPSKLQQSNNTTTPTSDTTPTQTPRNLTPQPSPTRPSSISTAIPVPHPFKQTASSSIIPTITTNKNPTTTHLPPTLLRPLREAFSLLDRDADGLVTPTDISHTLTTLSLPPSHFPTPFFPPSTSTTSTTQQTLSLPTYLSTLSTLLAPLSSSEELLNAFAAFDEKDSGEIDVRELRDAVLNTRADGGGKGIGEQELEVALEGFVGKRAFGRDRAMGRGEVFKYREWVGGIMGGADEKGEEAK